MKKSCDKCGSGKMIWHGAALKGKLPKYQHICDRCCHVEIYKNIYTAKGQPA